MVKSLWEKFLNLFRWGEKTDEESQREEQGRFIPSPLDLSVRVSHGGGDDDVVRELSKIEERAQELEDNQRRN